MPPLPPPQPPRRRGRVLVLIGVVAVVALAAVLAFVFGGGDDDSVTTGDAAEESVVTVPGGVAPGETQPVTVTGSPLPPLADSGDDDAIDLAAPALDGYDFEGAPVEIAPGTTPKMLVFLAHWCPHCNREIPRLLEWQASGRVPDGLEIIAVTTAVDSNADNYPPSEWLPEMGWTWPVLADSEGQDAAEAYGVTGFPYFVVVGTDGTVKVRFSGELEIEQLDGIVRSALSGES